MRVLALTAGSVIVTSRSMLLGISTLMHAPLYITTCTTVPSFRKRFHVSSAFTLRDRARCKSRVLRPMLRTTACTALGSLISRVPPAPHLLVALHVHEGAVVPVGINVLHVLLLHHRQVNGLARAERPLLGVPGDVVLRVREPAVVAVKDKASPAPDGKLRENPRGRTARRHQMAGGPGGQLATKSRAENGGDRCAGVASEEEQDIGRRRSPAAAMGPRDALSVQSACSSQRHAFPSQVQQHVQDANDRIRAPAHSP